MSEDFAHQLLYGNYLALSIITIFKCNDGPKRRPLQICSSMHSHKTDYRAIVD